MAVVSFSVVSSRMMPLERTCEVESARGADGTAARVEGMRNPSRLQYRADEAPSFAKSFTFDDKFGRDYVSLYHLPLTRTPVIRGLWSPSSAAGRLRLQPCQHLRIHLARI